MGKSVCVDASGVWIPSDKLEAWFGLDKKTVRRTLTHTKSKYKGPPWKALGYAFVTVDAGAGAGAAPREYCVLDRGIALALWKNIRGGSPAFAGVIPTPAA